MLSLLFLTSLQIASNFQQPDAQGDAAINALWQCAVTNAARNTSEGTKDDPAEVASWATWSCTHEREAIEAAAFKRLRPLMVEEAMARSKAKGAAELEFGVVVGRLTIVVKQVSDQGKPSK